MPYTTSSGTRIYYETRGSGEPLLMIEGFTAQLVGWREGFLAALVARGLQPVVFDNRDVGLSQKFGGEDDIDGGYGIADMAGDALAVADTLGIDKVHIMGQSMGGIIAQRLMIDHAERIRSATLIYTPPVAGRYRAQNLLKSGFDGAPERFAREEAIEAYVARERLSKSPAYDFDEIWARELGAVMYDRCYAPEGNHRQWRALQQPFDNLAALAECNIPASIIHGRDDGLVKVEAAFDLGAALRTAEVHVYPGMGHEIVEPLWNEFADIAARTVARG